MSGKIRKIAANYIFWPGYPLVKNAYLTWKESGETEIIDTGGEIREIQGLEFYGGMLVPAYVMQYKHLFDTGRELLSVLENIYARESASVSGVAIIEGADLKQMCWRENADIRVLAGLI